MPPESVSDLFVAVSGDLAYLAQTFSVRAVDVSEGLLDSYGGPRNAARRFGLDGKFPREVGRA
jgi:hypothetical protein